MVVVVVGGVYARWLAVSLRLGNAGGVCIVVGGWGTCEVVMVGGGGGGRGGTIAVGVIVTGISG